MSDDEKTKIYCLSCKSKGEYADDALEAFTSRNGRAMCRATCSCGKVVTGFRRKAKQIEKEDENGDAEQKDEEIPVHVEQPGN